MVISAVPNTLAIWSQNASKRCLTMSVALILPRCLNAGCELSVRLYQAMKPPEPAKCASMSDAPRSLSATQASIEAWPRRLRRHRHLFQRVSLSSRRFDGHAGHRCRGRPRQWLKRHRVDRLGDVARNVIWLFGPLAATVEEPVGVEIRRTLDEVHQRNEIAEKSDEQADAIGTEQLAARREQRRRRTAAEHTDKGRDVAELDIGFAVTVDVVDVPADHGTERARSN
jgi:hypothetical protein